MAVQDAIEAPVKLYTVADLEAMPNDGTRRTLIEGKLIEMPGAKPNHSEYQGLLVTFLTIFALAHKLGKVLPELGCQFTHDPDTIMFPDVGYVSFDRLGSHDMREYLPFAPDLAVEIMSPSNTDEEINNKIDWYLRFGARLIWVVYPNTQKVYVYSTEKPFAIVDRAGTLDGGGVLPDFTLALTELFSNQEKQA